MIDLKLQDVSDIGAILEIFPDATILVNETGEIVLCNKEISTMFGYNNQELVGLQLEVLIPERFRSRHPENQKKYFNNPRMREMGSGLELYGLKKNGTELPVEISLNPVRIKEKIYVVAAIRDVTLRRRSENKFRGLLEAAPDANVIVDAGGEILIVNAQTELLFGYTREEIIGKKVESLIPERFKSTHPQHREQFAKTPKTRPMGAGMPNLFGLRKDGTEFPVEISLSPLKLDNETIIIGSIRDITKRKEIERIVNEAKHKAEAAAAELETFSYSVAHDLRAPLRAIEAFSKILMTEHFESLNADAQKYLNKVVLQSKFMSRLIDDLLHLAKISRMELKRESVNISDMVRSYWSRITEDLPHNKTQLKISSEIMTEADPRLIGILIDNLIGNAIKYSSKSENPTIEVGQKTEASEVIYFVRDNGVGFDMAHYEKLFGVFQRLHPVKEFEGTGIGLATCLKVVQKHGGRIWADSQVNKGATFYFTLIGGNSNASQ